MRSGAMGGAYPRIDDLPTINVEPQVKYIKA